MISSLTLIDDYIQAKATLAPSTKNSYEFQLKHFNKFCIERNVEFLQAQEKDIAAYINQYKFIKTKKSYKTILSSFYKWAIKYHLISGSNPTEDIVIKGGTKKQHKLMKAEDFQNFINECSGLREQTIITFMWYTGVRIKELVSIRLKDISLEDDLIYVSLSKTENGIREIGIHPNLKPVLEKYIEVSNNIRKELKNPHKELFLNKHGKPLGTRTLQNIVENLQSSWSTKGPKFGCHDFRRAFVTNVYNSSGDIVLAQKLAGHAKIDTTRGYILDNTEEQNKKFKSLVF